MERICRKYWI